MLRTREDLVSMMVSTHSEGSEGSTASYISTPPLIEPFSLLLATGENSIASQTILHALHVFLCPFFSYRQGNWHPQVTPFYSKHPLTDLQQHPKYRHPAKVPPKPQPSTPPHSSRTPPWSTSRCAASWLTTSGCVALVAKLSSRESAATPSSKPMVRPSDHTLPLVLPISTPSTARRRKPRTRRRRSRTPDSRLVMMSR